MTGKDLGDFFKLKAEELFAFNDSYPRPNHAVQGADAAQQLFARPEIESPIAHLLRPSAPTLKKRLPRKHTCPKVELVLHAWMPKIPKGNSLRLKMFCQQVHLQLTCMIVGMVLPIEKSSETGVGSANAIANFSGDNPITRCLKTYRNKLKSR